MKLDALCLVEDLFGFEVELNFVNGILVENLYLTEALFDGKYSANFTCFFDLNRFLGNLEFAYKFM